MNTKFLLFLTSLCIILSCNRCKEECDDPTNPDCPNYVPPAPIDPCQGKSEVSAEFSIEQKVGSPPSEAYFRLTEGAVCGYSQLTGSYLIRLYALQEGLIYKWVIGSDTIYNREYIFQFSHEFCGDTYPLKLIVQGEPDISCFPYDNGMDTLVRYIPVIDFYDNDILGSFKVAWDTSPLDSFDVHLSSYYDAPTFQNYTYSRNFSNLESIDSCWMEIAGYGYNYLELTTNLGSDCRKLRGEFWINNDQTFEAQYLIDIDPAISITNLQPFHAKGRKIN